jgi:hypothetical protein
MTCLAVLRMQVAGGFAIFQLKYITILIVGILDAIGMYTYENLVETGEERAEGKSSDPRDKGRTRVGSDTSASRLISI